MMPLDLVLVRHGESEGNLANKRSRQGNHADFTKEFVDRHSSEFRLTDRGVWQSQMAGQWLKFNGLGIFDRYYVSEYVRAMETAVKLDLVGANWYPEFFLRERDYGEIDVMTDEERRERFGDFLKRFRRYGFLTPPPGGESMATLCVRTNIMLGTMHRECSDKRVIIVNHGEVMWSFRVRLERIPQWRYKELESSQNPHDRMHNCQILHYTRIDPFTGKTTKYYQWMRSVCPWDLTLSSNEWQRIVRPTYSNDDLAQIVNRYKRLVNETADAMEETQ